MRKFLLFHEYDRTYVEISPERMWEQMREIVIASFPKARGIPHDPQTYLKDIDDI